MPDVLAAPTPISLRSPMVVITLLALLTTVLIAGFMTLGARGDWGFILAFRGRKLLALLLVGYAIALSTVIFQTITQNRILTPAIMGFDALFILLQSLLVFLFGGLAVLTFNAGAMFALETLVMSAFAALIYGFLFFGARRSLHLVMLVGIVLGTLFRGLTDFLVRLIDPNEFATLQDLFYAGFNAVETDILGLCSIVLLAASFVAWRKFPVWDVLALGRDSAVNLGVAYRREVLIALSLVTLLVSTSTALVGPVTFFGLLVANLAYLITPSHKHAHIVPVAALVAAICLIGGQMLLERVFAFNSSLSIIIEFAGGIVFIVLLLRGKAR